MMCVIYDRNRNVTTWVKINITFLQRYFLWASRRSGSTEAGVHFRPLPTFQRVSDNFNIIEIYQKYVPYLGSQTLM